MSFRFLLRPKWIFWSAVVVVAAVVMVNLSLWQWDRLQERRERNADIVARAEEPPEAVDELLAGVGADELGELNHRAVTAVGEYDPQGEVLVPNRTYEGSPGSWVITPLVLDDGTAVAVNRGWISVQFGPDDPREAFAPPEGAVEVRGVLQQSQDRRGGPTDAPGTLPRVNLDMLGDRLDVALLPMWIQLEDQTPPVADGLPLPLPPPELGDGPHLGYAGQWLIFASLTLVVYGVLVVRTARTGGDDGRGSAVDPDPAGGDDAGGEADVAGAPPVGESSAGAVADHAPSDARTVPDAARG